MNISMGLLVYLLLHFCIFTLFFVFVQRPVFYLYNRRFNKVGLSFRDIADISYHGMYTDVKVGAYLTVLPFLMAWLYAHGLRFDLTFASVAYDLITSLIIALLCVADTVLYRFWQFKIEVSVLAYLRSLKGAFASVSVIYILTALLAVIVMAALLFVVLLTIDIGLNPSSLSQSSLTILEHILTALCGLVFIGLFYVIIRGLHIRPDTPIYSYYCNNQYLNHSSVNPIYNFIYSIHLSEDFSKQFHVFEPAYCKAEFEKFFPTGGTPQVQLLNTPRPNILLIIWESLCAHFVEVLGGKPGIMPCFNRLACEGVLFTNYWAGSFRTDRGLVCTLSGYPSPPTTSVILHTAKLPHLPALPRQLRDSLSYETMAVHGGELKIFHKADYYWASGHDRLIEEKDLPRDPDATRWGVQDGKVFDWLADDIIKKAEGRQASAEVENHWFTTLQTLSSHEPFRVPYDRIKGNNVDNAFAYTDEAFGRFVDRLRTSPVWSDLLIIVTGDHGIDLNVVPDKDHNSHLPLLFLGGAVRQPMKIDTLMSQTDIAATLLGQMHLPHADFPFSRDVLADSYTHPFALHTYNNGFIFRDVTGVTNYDNVFQQALDGHDLQREETAKIILQILYEDFSKR